MHVTCIIIQYAYCYMFSVSRLLTFLGCHDDSAPLVIGELYGYQLGGGGGYLYPTAGSGYVSFQYDNFISLL